MVGSVTTAPIPAGQGQNAYQQAQSAQSPAAAEQRDPRENEVQRRNEPAAQSQDSQFLREPDKQSGSEFGLAEVSGSRQANDNPPTGGERGELLDVLV